MNRYTLDGILADLAAGRTVLIVSDDDTDHRAQLLEHIMGGDTPPGNREYRWNDARPAWLRDDTGGGAATFTTSAAAALDHIDPDVIVQAGDLYRLSDRFLRLVERHEVIDGRGE